MSRAEEETRRWLRRMQLYGFLFRLEFTGAVRGASVMPGVPFVQGRSCLAFQYLVGDEQRYRRTAVPYDCDETSMQIAVLDAINRKDNSYAP